MSDIFKDTNLIWETVTIKQHKKNIKTPMVSVGHGRMIINTAACNLINNIFDYEWADIVQAKRNSEIVFLGIKFTKIPLTNSLHVRTIQKKGSELKSLVINSQELVRIFFGEKALRNSTTRYSVTLKEDNTLVVDLKNPL